MRIKLPDIDKLKGLIMDYSQTSLVKLSENRKAASFIASGLFMLILANRISKKNPKKLKEKEKKSVSKKNDKLNQSSKSDHHSDNDDNDNNLPNANNNNVDNIDNIDGILTSNINIEEIKSAHNNHYNNNNNSNLQSKNFRIIAASSQAEYITNISYTLFFHLKEEYEYIGISDIKFDLLDSPLLNKEGIILEWDGDKILYISINDNIIENTSILWDGRYIIIPLDYVEINTQNNIIIKYMNRYTQNTTKKGLVYHSIPSNNINNISSNSFNDHKHTHPYIYTISQLNIMHTIFPCFDQPNMKANFNLLIYAPEDWSVITNQSLINVSNAKYEICKEIKVYIKNTDDLISQEYSLNSFLTMKNLPPYLFGFCCGQFKQSNYALNQFINGHLRLYYPITEFYTEIIDVIKSETEKNLTLALKFANKYIGQPYPHTKCDIIIIPGFEYDFLELPGCIFLTDKIFTDYKPNLDEQINRIVSIIHPIFKIWFGYLIGIKNTEDYWLFEGITLHLAFECMLSNHELLELGPRNEQSCHQDDLLIALSWIKQQIYQVELASPMNFYPQPSDYQALSMHGMRNLYSLRNARLIKQLEFMLNPDLLNTGIQRLFSKFLWKAISTQDFLDYFSNIIQRTNQNLLLISHDKFINAASFELTKFDMNTWAEHWLYSPGVNILELEWDKSNEMFKNLLKIKQSNRNKKKSINRAYRLNMALFNQDLQKYKVKEFYIEDRTYNDIILEDLQRIPSSILLNYQDNSYVIIKFKPDEIQFFKQNFSKIQDMHAISEILNGFKNNVYLSTLYVMDYLELIEIYMQMSFLLPKSKVAYNPHIINYSLRSVHNILENLVPIKFRKDMGTRLLKVILKVLVELNINKKNISTNNNVNIELVEDMTYILNERMIYLIYTNEMFDIIYEHLKDSLTELSTKSIIKLIELSYYFKASEYIKEKLKRIYFNHHLLYINEDIVNCKLNAICLPKNQRQQLWNIFINIGHINKPYNLIESQMEGFNYMGCASQYHPNYTKEFFNAYKIILEYADIEYSRQFFTLLYPMTDDILYHIEELEILLTHESENLRSLRPMIKKKIEELQLKYDIFKFNKFYA